MKDNVREKIFTYRSVLREVLHRDLQVGDTIKLGLKVGDTIKLDGSDCRITQIVKQGIWVEVAEAEK